MNNEIKEIIENMKEWSVDGNLYFEINDEKAKLLYDYITNLQEENKDLREKNKEAHDFDETMKDIKENLIARIQRQECEIHNLKARNEKAIEHIKHNEIYDIKENEINKTLFDILEGKE